RPRPDDRRGHGRGIEEPRQRHVGRLLAELAAEALPRLELRATLLDALPDPLARPPALVRLAEHPAEQSARERAPRDHAYPEPAVVRLVAHLPVDLGGQDDALAAAAALGEPAPDDLLGHALARPPAVDVGGVEEVDAELQRPVHDGEALGLGGERAEVHGAEAEAAYLEPRPAETRVVHA